METIFGRTYDTVGSSNSDFIIKTRGLVKIQYGNKFIDLIKDGKINSGALDFIRIVNDKSDIGTITGIYYVKSTGTVHIVVDGKIIDLVGDDIGTTYVSFLGKLEVTGEQKHLALTNIGFLYETMEEAQDSGISSGIIFVEESLKLYIVTNEGLTEYLMNIPNPFTLLLVILKNDDLEGALIIKGEGKLNALIVGNIYIYEDSDRYIIDSSEGTLSLRTEGNDRIVIQNNITMRVDTIFDGAAISEMFKSPGATNETGFRLYMLEGLSYLEVDNLIVRNSDSTSFQYPAYWATSNNVISGILEVQDEALTGYEISLKLENKYEVGDILYSFVILNNENEGFKLALQIPFLVEVVNTEGDRNVVYASLLLDYIDLSLLSLTSEDEILSGLIDLTIYLSAASRDVSILRIGKGNIDLLSPKSVEEELNLESISSRIGDIKELNLEIEVTCKDLTETILVELDKSLGIYSDLLVSKGGQHFNPNSYAPIFRGGPNFNLFPMYEENFEIPDEDDSKVVVTSEWVRRLLKKLLPPGTIVQWAGSSVPDGWALCDGSNGTPNLIDLFIKAGSSAGTVGGAENNEVTLKVENLPSHNHSLSGSVSTSTNGGYSHGYTAPVLGKSDNEDDRDVMEFSLSSTTSYAGDHSHTVNLSGITVSNTGNGTPIKIEPRYYLLMFIMKLDD